MSNTPDEVIREKWIRDLAKQREQEAAKQQKKQHVHEQRERARQRRVKAKRGK